MKSIVLGGGCFWCAEAVFQRVKGVKGVVSGYAGGTSDRPNYDRIGDHAEVVQIMYDESTVSLETLLEIFFYTHNPTTLNAQGNDYGTQYRSIILCASDELDTARAALKRARNDWDQPIITELKVLDTFYPAENYHQNYYNNNPQAGYCQVIINPKLEKFQKKFKEYIV